MITGVVGAYKTYTEYRAAKAEAEKAAAHGTAKEQMTLQLFEGDPATYQAALEEVLGELATTSGAFTRQLQTIAQQAQIQTGGAQGTVNVSGEAKVYGPVAGTNTGTMSGTYTFNDQGNQKK